MSYILDALQRSEAERATSDIPSLTRELLRVAEGVSPMAPEINGCSTENRPVATEKASASPAQLASDPTVFDQFESLPIVLSPDSKLISVTDRESLAAEKFRFLAVQLRQAQRGGQLKKVLITSSIPEEGKSTVAANLAVMLARRKHNKTLLLDGDLRRPTLESQLGLGKVSGLSDCLLGSANLRGSIYRLDALGLWILPAGKAPQNPLELMQSGSLTSLMDQLTSWFDWIVIDSPPLLPLGDTSIWSRMADGILLVTRQGKTEKEQLQRGLELIQSPKLLGALVNSSKLAVQSNYYMRYAPTPAASTKA
jgi:capsular exopolysaccharide synthesis family protein